MVKKRACVFISGAGTNLKSIINYSRDYNFPININLVISNKKDAEGIYFAKKFSIPHIVLDVSKEKFEKIALKELFNRKITSVIVEGGPKTLNCFLDQGLWDEARIFQGTNEFKFGIKAPIFDLSTTNYKLLMEDKLWIVQNK